jgi:hypothetical protein
LSADAVSQGSLPQLASRILALDINSEQLQRAALAVSSATDGAEQSAARRDAQHVVGAFLRQRLAVQAPTTVKRDTLRGRVTQELPRRRTP